MIKTQVIQNHHRVRFSIKKSLPSVYAGDIDAYDSYVYYMKDTLYEYMHEQLNERLVTFLVTFSIPIHIIKFCTNNLDPFTFWITWYFQTNTNNGQYYYYNVTYIAWNFYKKNNVEIYNLLILILSIWKG